MDVFDEEIAAFWKCLNNAKVRYIMVGGYATNMNGFQRYTGDIDMWIEDTIDNRNNLRIAFRNYGMGDFFMLANLQIIPGWTNFHLNNGMKLDLG